jgi:hypothetical protein
VTFISEVSAALIAGATTTFVVGPTTSTRVPIFLGSIPSGQQDTAVGIYESGGIGPTYTQGGGLHTRRPGCQIIVRSTSGSRVRSLADQVYTILGSIVNSTDFVHITPSQDPIDLGSDPDDRHQMSINLIAERTSS